MFYRNDIRFRFFPRTNSIHFFSKKILKGTTVTIEDISKTLVWTPERLDEYPHYFGSPILESSDRLMHVPIGCFFSNS